MSRRPTSATPRQLSRKQSPPVARLAECGTSDTAEATVTPALLNEMSRAFVRTAVLRTAVALRIFDALVDGPCPVEKVAAGVGASPRGTRILLELPRRFRAGGPYPRRLPAGARRRDVVGQFQPELRRGQPAGGRQRLGVGGAGPAGRGGAGRRHGAGGQRRHPELRLLGGLRHLRHPVHRAGGRSGGRHGRPLGGGPERAVGAGCGVWPRAVRLRRRVPPARLPVDLPRLAGRPGGHPGETPPGPGWPTASSTGRGTCSPPNPAARTTSS